MLPKQKNEPPALSDADYLSFLSSVELVGLGLKSSNSSINREIYFDLVDQKAKPVRRFSELYESTEIGGNFFEAEGRYEVSIADGDAIGLRIECVFEVHLHAPKPINPQMVQRFAKSDLRFMLLPYARQFVTGVTGQMQIPPIVLPMATARGKARLAKPKKAVKA